MSGLGEAVKRVAVRLEQALGHDAAQAEHDLMHGTGQRLQASARAHVEHDTNAASELERAAGGGRHEPTIRGGGDRTPSGSTAAGPSLHEPPTLHGDGGIGTRGIPDEQPLTTPTRPLSKADHDYLQEPTHGREIGAVDGPRPEPVPTVADRPDGWPELPQHEAANFTGPVGPVTLRAGKTYYRVVGDGTYPNGSYWTTSPPNGELGLRADLAVKNSWNGDHGIVTFTPHRDLQIGWGGTVGPQDVTAGSGHLPGGGYQIWIPDGRHPQGIGADDGEWTIGRMPEGNS